MWVSATFQPMCGKWPSTAMCSTLTSLPSKTLFLCKGGVRITSAVRENINGGVYPDEIKALQKDYADLWGPLSELLERLSEVVAL